MCWSFEVLSEAMPAGTVSTGFEGVEMLMWRKSTSVFFGEEQFISSRECTTGNGYFGIVTVMEEKENYILFDGLDGGVYAFYFLYFLSN